jgi:hypothetical protein
MREKQMRVSSEELQLLKTVRETAEGYDSSIPLGYVVGDLAREKLSSDVSDDSGVNF